MFSIPPFESLISGYTLRFSSAGLESYYRRIVESENNYLRSFSPFYMILIATMIMTSDTSYQLWYYYSLGNMEVFSQLLEATLLFTAAAILELLVNIFKRTRFLRSAPYCVLAFAACVLGTTPAQTPSLRPGYICNE